MQSQLIKKFLLSSAGFIVILVIFNLLMQFHFRRIQKIVLETKNLTVLQQNKVAQLNQLRDVQAQIKSLENKFSLSLPELKKVLEQKTRGPSQTEIGNLLQTTARRYGALTSLEQLESQELQGAWQGQLAGFEEFMRRLKAIGLAVRFSRIEIEGVNPIKPQLSPTYKIKFIISTP